MILTIRRQFLSFALVGVIATCVQYVILAILVERLGVHPVWSSAAGFGASTLVNYWLNHRFTFGGLALHLTALPRFLTVALVGLLLNTGIMALAYSMLLIHYLLSQVLASALVLLWTFTANRWWSFRS